MFGEPREHHGWRVHRAQRRRERWSLVACIVLWAVCTAIAFGVLATTPPLRTAFELECEQLGGKPIRVAAREAGAVCISADGRVVGTSK